MLRQPNNLEEIQHSRQEDTIMMSKKQMLKFHNNQEEIQISRLEDNRMSNKTKEKEYNNNRIIIFSEPKKPTQIPQ